MRLGLNLMHAVGVEERGVRVTQGALAKPRDPGLSDATPLVLKTQRLGGMAIALDGHVRDSNRSCASRV